MKCSKLKMSPEEIDIEINSIENGRYVRFIDRLNIIHKKCLGVAFCQSCNYPYPLVREIDGQFYKILDGSKRDRIEINELLGILSNISIEDLKIMGFQPETRTIKKHSQITEEISTFRPEWMIITHLPVLPPMSRPPNNEGENKSDDDLTTSYSDIIKINKKLADTSTTEVDRAKDVLKLYEQIRGLLDNSDGKITRNSGKVAKGIKPRLSGKDGHVRGRSMGKRVDCSARTVITADPYLRLNEVGIPEEIAQQITFPEYVTKRNIVELKELMADGKINTVMRNGNPIFVKISKRKINLQYGDIAYRHLRDGDTVVFNRQPTLHRGSMMAHYARVLPGKTFRLNLSVTTPYNADFDGDEMQAHIPQDYGTVAEVQCLMGVNNMIVSSQASRPIMGVIQDCLLGAYLLTHKEVKVKRHHFMDCIVSAGDKYVDGMGDLMYRAKKFYAAGGVFNGRVLFSALLPRDFQYSCKNNADPNEPTVVIKYGILTEGIIDKKIIGRSAGSIIHRLYKEYGPDRAAEFLSSIQFLVNRWLSYRGFSVGPADFVISKENHEGVQIAIKKAYLEVESIEQSNDPDHVKEFRINNTLNNRGQSLAINGLCKNNRLNVMIDSGSKGSKMNVIQIAGHLGQNNVEGQRIKRTIDNGSRTLSCFERGDNHPRSRGFIESSFMKGLEPYELWFHTVAGREGIINTAVKTKDSGYTERKLVKRMEDLTVMADQTVRNSTGNIISFSYGDSLDPTLMYGYNKTESATFMDIGALADNLNAESYEFTEEDHNTTMHEIITENTRTELEERRAELDITLQRIKGKRSQMYKEIRETVQNEVDYINERLEELD